MKPPSTRSTAWFAGSLLAAASLVNTPAYSQPTDQTAPLPEARSLLDALSLVSGQMLVAPAVAPVVTHDGAHFHVHIPLPRLTAPQDAAIEVAATPLDGGVWDITELTLPASGTLANEGSPGHKPVSLRFTIGQQTTHARIDPTLAVPSPYAMALSDIGLQFDSDASPANLTIGQLTAQGTITGDAGGRMSTKSEGRTENWHFTATNKEGRSLALSLRAAAVRSEIDGLDRAQADRLRQAAHALAASRQDSQGETPSSSPAVREQLRAMIEASRGLLSRFDIDETLDGLHFETAGASGGDVSTVRLAVAANAAGDRMSGHFDIGLDELTLAAVPAAFTPHRVALRTAFSGIAAEALRHWLRQATETGADPAALQAQAVALLNAPDARLGIENLLVETGPLRVEGTARVRPQPDGTAGVDIHLTAHGVDAMLALVQADPKLHQVLPLLFLAKGMAKNEGDALVWNVAFADGRLTVNGTRMGEGAGHQDGGHQGGGQQGGGRQGGGVPGPRSAPSR